MHLERILQGQGVASRKECRALIRDGRVTVNGVACDDPYADFAAEPSLVYAVDGFTLPWLAYATLVLHKPAGYECSRKPTHHPDITGLLPPPLRARGVQPVGRLDHDTTGLLILTDDGQLNHRLSSPKHHTPKVYEARCARPVDATQIAALLAGVLLHDEPLPIAAAEAVAIGPETVRLTLVEGKYHQVKRMLAAVGNHVEALCRVRIGGFALPAELAPGQWRFLDAAEIASLLA